MEVVGGEAEEHRLSERQPQRSQLAQMSQAGFLTAALNPSPRRAELRPQAGWARSAGERKGHPRCGREQRERLGITRRRGQTQQRVPSPQSAPSWGQVIQASVRPPTWCGERTPSPCASPRVFYEARRAGHARAEAGRGARAGGGTPQACTEPTVWPAVMPGDSAAMGDDSDGLAQGSAAEEARWARGAPGSALTALCKSRASQSKR